MRRILAGLLFLGALAALRAADGEFVRVWPGWRSAESFDRIGEFFGGETAGQAQIALRTQPSQREGFYFLVRLKTAAAPAGGKFLVHVIRPDSPEVRDHTLPVATGAAGENVFQLGLTGADWPGGAKANPVAWKLEFVAADGRVLATLKSFLWEKPAK